MLSRPDGGMRNDAGAGSQEPCRVPGVEPIGRKNFSSSDWWVSVATLALPARLS